MHFSGASEAKPDWVLDTDYDNFVSGYQCQNETVESAYIRTRVRNPSTETVSLTFKLIPIRWGIFLMKRGKFN